jgi:hypothetical protein
VNREPSEQVSRLDALAEAAGPENVALTDEVRVVRWTGPMFALLAIFLLPWTVYLGVTLPARQVSVNYDVAWVGFDIILLLALASTAYFAMRRSRYLAITAGAAATLLVVDAWFDCVTTPADQLWESILLAVVIELPLAAVCTWLSYHTQHLSEQRIMLLLRRRQ